MRIFWSSMLVLLHRIEVYNEGDNFFVWHSTDWHIAWGQARTPSSRGLVLED